MVKVIKCIDYNFTFVQKFVKEELFVRIIKKNYFWKFGTVKKLHTDANDPAYSLRVNVSHI